MTLPQTFELFDYWEQAPPENEMLAMLATVYTTWKPGSSKPLTPEQHLASLEERWRSGAAMSPKQMFEAMGGKGGAIGADGVMRPFGGAEIPGVGPFPGVH
jgi:hypothetical protein